jgi:polysaccharide biosynthesis/export protein
MNAMSRGATAVLFVLVIGCGPTRGTRDGTGAEAPAIVPGSAGDLVSARDRARLEAIGAARSSGTGSTSDGYRIGPDDLLEVRIPDLLQVADGYGSTRDAGIIPVVAAAPVASQGVRVSGNGDITLPVIGTVRAAGHTALSLEKVIAGRLVGAGVLRHPQVSVQITEYRSHVVAVVGSVERPGLYPVTRPGATLADLIWAAGGPNRDAGRVVEFVPASDDSAGNAPARLQLASATPKRDPVRLDLQMLLHPTGADGLLMTPPVRPGDLISLSPAGTVQVDGWVQKPGSYPLTRGLTLTGAVAAAGGNLFPADRTEVTVKRTLGSGEQRFIKVDVLDVTEGRAADLPMIDGDVVQVPASYERLAPWAVWQVVREVVQVGGSMLLF